MNLGEMLRGIVPVETLCYDPGTEITGISYDSRRVKKGDLFVAVPGFKQDGASYVPDAMARGAAAVLGENILPGVGVPQAAVGNVRAALARASMNFYGDPSRDMVLLGVTGTNGKTTTAYLIRHMLNCWNVPCGMIGTVEIDTGARKIASKNTTPEAPDIHAYLNEMRASGMLAAVLEVSSHALALHRTDSLRFHVAAFTNLTQDHLDFHGDMESYKAVKGQLFQDLPANSAAVLNAADPASVDFSSKTFANLLTYSASGAGQLRAEILEAGIRGTRFNLVHGKQEAEVRWTLLGSHNVENALAAAGVCLSLGMPLETVAGGLSSFQGVPGRLESVAPAGCPFTVLVDYAHTPDALECVLASLRKLKPNRVLTVFGCGGDRDRGKRPKMARAVEKASNFTVVTSDNPRSEDPLTIIREVTAGFESLDSVIVRPNRALAIREAIRFAGPGDLVLIAGKGHENYQVFAGGTEYFDDREQAREAIRERLANSVFAVPTVRRAA